MALASVLRSELPEFHKSSSGLSKTFPDDSEDFPEIPEVLRDPPGPPRVLAAPPWGVEAVPDGPGLAMLHGTTTLAFKVRGKPPQNPIWDPKIPSGRLRIPFGTLKSRLRDLEIRLGGPEIPLRVPRTRWRTLKFQ